MKESPAFCRGYLFKGYTKDSLEMTFDYYYFMRKRNGDRYIGIDHGWSIEAVNYPNFDLENITEKQYLEHYFSKNIIVCL